VVTPERWVRGSEEAAKIILTWFLNEEERRFVGTDAPLVTTETLVRVDATNFEADEGVQALLERYEHDAHTGKIEYFPASRTVLPYGARHGTAPIVQRILRAQSDLAKYSFVPQLLRELRDDDARAEYFGTVLGYLSTTARYQAPPRGHEPWECISSRGGSPVAPHELSHSELDAVIFAAVATMLQLSHSVVLCDRPDLHATPERAAAYLAALRSLGNDNQIIVTTSSREIIQAMDPAQVFALATGGA